MSKFFNNIVLGIDVAADFSYVTILNKDGSILCKSFKVNHNLNSFTNFANLLSQIEKQHNDKPKIFLESTGNYHLPLSYFLKSMNFEVNVINPLVVHSIKNQDIRKVKNDKNDSLKIATLSKYQDIKFSSLLSEEVYTLRSLTREYYSFIDNHARAKLKLSSELRIIFPGYINIFSDITSITSLSILEKYPLPSDIISASKDDIVNLISVKSRKGLSWSLKTYSTLISTANDAMHLAIKRHSIVISSYISLINTLNTQIDYILKEIHNFIDSPNFDALSRKNIYLLESIPGVGFITAVTILAEIGDFSRFPKPKHLIAFFGIDPSVNQSGKFEGDKNKMSKRGTRIGRRALYAVALASIRSTRNGQDINPVLKQYYLSKSNSKKKKVALVAVMHKLMNYIFAVLREQKPYEVRTPDKHSVIYLNSKRKAA